ncbi:MAG: hypothetical protein FD163_68 [Hyphomonadaceae bacterium]|nr:MAG: hypothetical protein FD128_472 [Hyphomonadaceae bacterium]KAF0186793.1 MAG: hypothetical protein FD163_68 [Hyphomonadaceae bacterium]
MTKVQNIASCAIEELRRARNDFQIMEAMARLVALIDCSNFQMAPGPFCPLPSPDELLDFGNFDAPHRKFYISETSALCDPVRKIALNFTGSVGWRKVFMEAKNPSERNFINEIRGLGIKDGLTIPIHGPIGCVAMLMFASKQHLALVSEDEEALNLVAITMLQRIKHIKAAALFPKPATTSLTMREIECLGWVLEGKTNWEIGVLMGVAARTVQFHLANSARKMGVHNRIQSAVRALVEGVILPPAPNETYKHFSANNSQSQCKSATHCQSAFAKMEYTQIGDVAANKSFRLVEMALKAQETLI